MVVQGHYLEIVWGVNGKEMMSQHGHLRRLQLQHNLLNIRLNNALTISSKQNYASYNLCFFIFFSYFRVISRAQILYGNYTVYLTLICCSTSSVPTACTSFSN